LSQILIIKINSVYEKLVPNLSILEYQDLKNSIQQNGMYIPIIINKEGEILDGHHRYKACKELGIEPKVTHSIFTNKLEEKKFVIENCIKRRHLNDFQKAELAIPLLEIEKELAMAREQNGTLVSNETRGKTTEKVAKQIGLSGGTMARCKVIIEQAPEETKEKLRNNKLTVYKVYNQLRKAKKREARLAELEKTQISLPETIQLHNEDFRNLQLADNSISLIFTDPPYTEIDLYEEMAKQAYRVLKEGGSLVCYVAHRYLDKVMEAVKKSGLNYHWSLAIIHSGPPATIFGDKVIAGHKPMLWFTKGRYEGELVKDTIKSEFQGKELHEWAQSTVESDYYIKYMTEENEIVYDPFMGQGTFGISAKNLKRQFIGCEIDPEHFETAQRMISN